jgi:hypothetical protein
LKEKYPDLKNEDLKFEIGKEQVLLNRLEITLNNNCEEVRIIIEINRIDRNNSYTLMKRFLILNRDVKILENEKMKTDRNYETVSEALNDLAKRGYTTDFLVHAEQECLLCNKIVIATFPGGI